MMRILMQALADQAAFLALSGNDVVNPDAAVAQLELLGALLQALSPDERRVFIGFCRELAESERDPERGEFFESLPENLGMIE